MSHGSLREDDLENCESDDNSVERVCPTKMGQNDKSVDEHSEENTVVIGKVTSGKMIELGESTRGIELFPRFLPILVAYLHPCCHTETAREAYSRWLVGREEM